MQRKHSSAASWDYSANPHGPAKPPAVFDTFNADSANAEAHCTIAISEEPAQTIDTINNQNPFLLRKLFLQQQYKVGNLFYPLPLHK